MTELKDLPTVTVEQTNRFRGAALTEIYRLTQCLREAEEYGEKMRDALEEVADSGVLTGSFELHDRMSEVAYVALSLPKPWEKKYLDKNLL
jgi:hypothetical protein